MPELGAKITLDDFVKVSTHSALEVLREHEKLGSFKVPPKIWVGIILDPWDRFGGAGGPIGGGGPLGGGKAKGGG